MNHKIDDKCPKWADEMIVNLFQIEQYLGNIPSNEGWRSNYVEEIQVKASNEKKSGFKESDAEMVFGRIVKGLVDEQFNPEEILQFINARVGYEGGPKYCTLEEVKEAIDL